LIYWLEVVGGLDFRHAPVAREGEIRDVALGAADGLESSTTGPCHQGLPVGPWLEVVEEIELQMVDQAGRDLEVMRIGAPEMRHFPPPGCADGGICALRTSDRSARAHHTLRTVRVPI
jgi:hypothetical protein